MLSVSPIFCAVRHFSKSWIKVASFLRRPDGVKSGIVLLTFMTCSASKVLVFRIYKTMQNAAFQAELVKVKLVYLCLD